MERLSGCESAISTCNTIGDGDPLCGAAPNPWICCCGWGEDDTLGELVGCAPIPTGELYLDGLGVVKRCTRGCEVTEDDCIGLLRSLVLLLALLDLGGQVHEEWGIWSLSKQA